MATKETSTFQNWSQLIVTTIIWLKYYRYSVKNYSINESINPLNIHICAHTASHAYRVNTRSPLYNAPEINNFETPPSKLYIVLVFCNDPMSCYICSAILFIYINLSWTVFFTLNFWNFFNVFKGILNFILKIFLISKILFIHMYIIYIKFDLSLFLSL